MTADLDDAAQLAILQQAGATPPTEKRFRHLTGERTMRQAEVYAAVLRMAGARGLRVIHGPSTAMLAQGWPDLVIMGPRGMLFRKLLDEHGQLHPDCSAVLNALRRNGSNAALWRPEQLHDDTIEAELDMVASQRPTVYQLRCEQCEEPFEGTMLSRRFCSGKCRVRHARQVKKQQAEAAGYA